MSQSSSVTASSPNVTTFLSTFTPTVVRYLSAKMLLTKRETRLVLPTPVAPSMQIFFWIIDASLSRAVGRQHAQRHAAVALLVRLEHAVGDRLAAAGPAGQDVGGRQAFVLECRAHPL